MGKTMMWGSGAASATVQGITGVPATITANGQTDPIDIADATRLLASVKVGTPGGTNPTIQFVVECLDAIGNWLPVLILTELTAANYTYGSTGPGSANVYVLTRVVRFRWVVGGTSPSWPGAAVALAGS